jgi:hypothetical protein
VAGADGLSFYLVDGGINQYAPLVQVTRRRFGRSPSDCCRR